MSTLTIRVDEKLKKEASKVYESTGLNLSSAITMFLKQTVLKQRFPITIDEKIAADYSFTYPKDFFELFGSVENGIEVPEDTNVEPENFEV